MLTAFITVLPVPVEIKYIWEKPALLYFYIMYE